MTPTPTLHSSECLSNLSPGSRKSPCHGPLGHPDHSKCDNSLYSAERCFAEAGFHCANAYLMPCTPGDPTGCPRFFR